MGSFDFTCSVSGLPIGAGDPVRFLLLTENPYHSPAEHTCYIDGHWIPRAYPIKAKYNDYGSIEDVQGGPLQETILEGFKRDLIERGTGGNQCHDVPVRADMGLEGFLEALWEGRVLVKRNKDGLDPEGRAKAVEDFQARTDHHPGVPTLRSVREALTSAGLPVVDGNFAEGFLLDSEDFGFVCIRWGGHTKSRGMLQQAQEVLAPLYATMITTGTESYHDGAELQTAPKPLLDITEVEDKSLYDKEPAKFRYPYAFKRKERDAPLHVAQAMIREDVWQAICSLKIPHWNKEVPGKCADWRAKARVFYKDLLAYKQRLTGEQTTEDFLESMRWREKAQYGIFSPGECVGSLVNLHDHLDLMVAKGITGQELEDFLDLVAEMHFIQFALGTLRYQWNPAASHGPQFGEWALHKQYFKVLSGVTKAKLKEIKDDE